MDDKTIIELYEHHVRELRLRVEQQALQLAEQSVLLDNLVKSADKYIRLKLYIQVFALVLAAVMAVFGAMKYLAVASTAEIVERCTKFEGLGIKTEICNTTPWSSILMILVLALGTYAGVKYVDRLSKSTRE